MLYIYSIKMRNFKIFFGILVFLVTSSIMYYSIERYPESHEEYQIVLDRWRNSNRHYNGVKTILYWNKMYAEQYRHFMFGSGDIFKDCTVPHCYATPDRKLLNSVSDYDAVLFHGIEMNLWDLPHSRSSYQRYIYYSRESALSRPINHFEFALEPNFYNWTMAYRLDSDIIRSYGLIRDIETNKIVFPPKNINDIIQWRYPNETNYNPSNGELLIMKNKIKMAAWFVSHCNSLSYRDHLVKELQKHLEVDVYGSCGKLKCEKDTDACYDLVEKNYFYYLSFENTLCKDYITEKVYLPMQKYIIPVVYSGGNYTKFLPPHSYIDIYDFGTTKDLANFMINLAKNPYEYASYFWWKKYYQIEDPTKFTLCNMCAMLHNESLPRTSIENFQKYYITDQCQTIKFDVTKTNDKLIFNST